MTKAEVILKLQEIFDRVFLEPVVVTEELSAEQVDEWDSLLQISLIASVEEVFGIRFRMGEVETTNNIGEFAQLIIRHHNTSMGVAG